MTHDTKRPIPFTSNHEWVDDCSHCCTIHRGPGRHCLKCAITHIMAKERSYSIEVEACPARCVAVCSQCQQLSPISTESQENRGLCFACQYPNSIHCATAEEAIGTMLTINKMANGR